MLTKRYLTSVKNLPAIMAKIVEGTAPKKFTIAHLKSIGFPSSNDRGMLALLKDLGFLSDDGAPSRRYHDYRDASRSPAIMAEALREAYEDLFHISERPGPSHRAAIEGKIKSALNVSDRVARESASTFLALLRLADLDAPPGTPLHQDNEDSGSSFSGSGQEIRVLGVKVLLRGADRKGAWACCAAYAPSWNNPHPSGILGTLSSSNRTRKSRGCVTNWRATRACIVRTAACSVRSSGWSARTST